MLRRRRAGVVCRRRKMLKRPTPPTETTFWGPRSPKESRQCDPLFHDKIPRRAAACGKAPGGSQALRGAAPVSAKCAGADVGSAPRGLQVGCRLLSSCWK